MHKKHNHLNQFKNVAVIALGLLAVNSTFFSRPSQAIVGLATVNPLLTAWGAGLLIGAIPGGVVAALLTGGTLSIAMHGSNSPERGTAALTIGFMTGGALAAGALATGLVLLDTSESGDWTYKPLDLAVAKQMGLNEQEVELFNQNIPELNAIRETVAIESRQLAVTHPKMKLPDAIAHSQRRWVEFASQLEGLTPTEIESVLKVAHHISAHAFKN